MALHSRIKRINEEIKHTLAMILLTELKDPRIKQGMVTVTHVAVAKDLHNAQVFVSVLGNDEETSAVLQGLSHSAPFIRHLLGQRLVLKYIPTLHFKLDASGREAAHINQMLKDIERSQPRREETHEDSEV